MVNSDNTMKQLQPERGRYFMYCRKSSDTEDRQVQSIPDQIRALTELAQKQGIEIVEVLQESKSAKAPGRPVFTSMIERISKGEANGVIAWKLNRLARNPVDGGTISWMLQQGVLRHIQTHDRSYYPGDNVIVMAVELGMANQYVRDLSVDTKRGLRTRENEKGYPNGVAPMGFRNDMTKEPGDRGWVVDKERYQLVKQLLDLFATGKYSIRQLTRIANEQMGLRTPIHKRQGGKPLVLSYVAGTLLRNPVYAGFFYVNNGTERRELNKDVPRMISESQYWHIQKILGNKGRARPSVNRGSFAYAGMALCGTCGGTVTAEHKYQLICPGCRKKFAHPNKTHCPGCNLAISKMEGPTYLHYIYYHCTKKKRPDCPEKNIREDEMDKHLASYFRENLCMSESLAAWCAVNIRTLDTCEQQNEFERKTSLERTLAAKRAEGQKLTGMRARDLLSDSEFLAAKAPLTTEIQQLEAEIAALGPVDPTRLQRAYRAFEIAVGVAKVFENGSPEEKQEILSETGSNLTLKEKKLNVSNAKLYAAIVRGLLTAKAENERFEPENCLVDKDETDTFVSVRPTLLRG